MPKDPSERQRPQPPGDKVSFDGRSIPSTTDRAANEVAETLHSGIRQRTRDATDDDKLVRAELNTILDRYSIDYEIARGGMGVILKAHDINLGRDVAIKLLLHKLRTKSDLRERFVAEARTTSQLQHPGIVPVYDVGICEDGRPFFVMKLVGGTTLTDLITSPRRSPLETFRLLKHFERVCDAIAYAHAQGVTHLDLKPANVMVGRFGEVHVMDWGLSINWEDQQIVSLETSGSANNAGPQDSTNIDGTPAYMAPEQARGDFVDPRSDVFGLGGILCEILTGKPPYHSDSLYDLCAQAANANLDDALGALSLCDRDHKLVGLAKKCLSPDPDDRPDDAGDVAYQITRYLETATEYAQSDLSRFFELSADLFCIASLDGYFLRVNANFSRVLGHSEQELMSRPFMDFVHADDREATIQAMSELTSGHDVVGFKNRYLDAKGEFRVLEWASKSIPDENTIFAVAREVKNQSFNVDIPVQSV